MKATELTLERVLTVWWAVVWRSTLVSGVAAAVVGGIGGYIVGLDGAPELGQPIGALLGWLVTIPSSIWAIREALRISYREFSISFVAEASAGAIDHIVGSLPADELRTSPIPPSTAVHQVEPPSESAWLILMVFLGLFMILPLVAIAVLYLPNS